jgi:hypothetical protein
MIAFLKLWIIAIILFENYFFMNQIDYLNGVFWNAKEKEGISIFNKKLYLMLFSIIRLLKIIKFETTYQSVMKFGISLFYSPLFLILYIFWMEL